MDEAKSINGFQGEYRFLSNFWDVCAQTLYQGKYYNTSEHAYVASMTDDPEVREIIARFDHPAKAKKYGKTIVKSEAWKKNKVDIMYEIVLDKFSRNPELREKLLATGDAYLEETNPWHDTFWGVCNGIGENNLGKILMRVRDELKKPVDQDQAIKDFMDPSKHPPLTEIQIHPKVMVPYAVENEIPYQFPCGCKFKILGEAPIEGGLPLLDIDINNLPSCPAAYKLLSSGNTKGIFQLESKLGRAYSKSLAPEEIEHLGALGSILRPGSLKAFDENGISITRYYCHRKNKEDIILRKDLIVSSEVPKYHPIVDKILEKTYGCLIYQEQSLELAKELAGYTLQQADSLRKCVTGDTMFVSKTRGWISIDTLLKTSYKDDEFLIMNSRGQQQWKKIKDIWSNGKKTVNEITSGTGFSIKATGNHQFLTNYGWKARSRLNIENDYLVLAKKIHFEGEDRYSPDLCLVIAGMITEGYIPENKDDGNHFTNYDKGMMDEFVRAYTSVFGESPSMTFEDRVARMPVAIKRKLKSYMKCSLSKYKELPQEMMGATKETTRKFLSYMLSAEGGVTKATGSFEFSSKSKKLANQVKLLLLRFGIRSNLLSRYIPGYPDKYYRLYINAIPDQKKLLKELVEFFPEYKINDLKNSLEKRVEQFTTDIIPHNIVIQMIDQYPEVAIGEGGRVYKESVGRKKFKRLAKKINAKRFDKIANGYHQYDAVSSIDHQHETIEVFDFTMEDGSAPYIVANGFVIHNSMGKKDAAEMSKNKFLFIEGCKKQGSVTQEQAEQIFGWIEKSNRYSFNKSHAISYGIRGYKTAWMKTHTPLAFYLMYLKYAKNNADPKAEMAALIADGKLFDVEVYPPDIIQLKKHFTTDGESIFFGLTDISGVGDSTVTKLRETVVEQEEALGKKLKDFTWLEFLLHVAPFVKSDSMKAIILAGGMRKFCSLSRQEMINHYEALLELTDKELWWMINNKDSAWKGLPDALKSLSLPRYQKPKRKKDPEPIGPFGGCHSVQREEKVKSISKILENPPTTIKDTPTFISGIEEKLLGIALTCSKVDSCDISCVNISVKEFLTGGTNPNMVLGVHIDEVRMLKTKKGKNPGRSMAALSVTDSSGSMSDVVIFPDEYDTYGALLSVGNSIAIQGERQKNGSSLVCKKIFQLFM